MKKNKQTIWEEDESIYSMDSRESLLEDGEIDSWEEAFMAGYDQAG